MRLLRAREFTPLPDERIFRPSRLGPFVLWCVFAAPLAFLLAHAGAVLDELRDFPWYAWLVLGPVAATGGGLYALLLTFLAATVQRSLGPACWLARVAPGGLALNLRSFQNAHFPDDAPTVLILDWSELAAVREVRDVTPPARGEESHARTRWLELELVAGSASAALAEAVRLERERPGPERKFLGLSSRSRSGHVPVFVPEPGRIHTDWHGRALLRALAHHVALGERRTIDRRAPAGTPLETRVSELVRRGESLAAIRLVRGEERLSLREAKERVEALARRIG